MGSEAKGNNADSGGSGSGGSRSDGNGAGDATQAKASSDTIVIHVCDEARGINRDFPCDRKTLLAEMRYFRAYLAPDGDENEGDKGGANGEDGNNNPVPANDDVDISVHCDVHIFEWLVRYINNPDNPPRIDSAAVVSILISSDFLEMARLVAHCLRFMSTRLSEIIKMPIDLNCISEKLVHQLADLIDANTLAGLRDKKDKLLSKLYKRRLELDFRNP